MPHRAWPNCLVLSTLAGPKASWIDPGSIPPFQWPGYPQGRWTQVVQEPTGPGPAISSSRLPRRFSAALLSLSSTSPVTEHKSVLDSLVGATRQHLDQTATRPRTSLRLPPKRREPGKVRHRHLSGSTRTGGIPIQPLRDGPRSPRSPPAWSTKSHPRRTGGLHLSGMPPFPPVWLSSSGRSPALWSS